MGKKDKSQTGGVKAHADALAPAPKAKPAAGLPVAPAEAGAAPTKKASKANEIDDIFSKAKKPAQAAEQAADAGGDHKGGGAGEGGQKKQAGSAAAAGPQPPAKKAKLLGNKDDLFGEDSIKKRKRTEDGYAIYSEDELGLGKKGGDTDLCPFDCDCCF